MTTAHQRYQDWVSMLRNAGDDDISYGRFIRTVLDAAVTLAIHTENA